MKSFIAASALALAATADSIYYIGNYSAAGSNRLVAYPLETCAPNGAFSFNYVVYHCTDDNQIYSEVYEMDDPYCESEYTETDPTPISMEPAKGGYADCSGQRNYMEVFQYLGSCNNWEMGKDPIATTVLATDACMFYGTDPGTGYPLYSKTVCTGDEQVSTLHVLDPTCSSGTVGSETKELGCEFFMNTTAGAVYSAMSRCVINNVVDRCTMPISGYTTHLQYWGLRNDTDLEALYRRMFPYSGLTISDMTGMAPNVNLTLDLTFCTEWEDRRFGPIVKNLGQETIDALNYAATICYMCVDSMCVNSTVCDPTNCVETEQCAPTTTSTSTEGPSTTMSSVSAVSVSIFTFLMTLLACVY